MAFFAFCLLSFLPLVVCCAQRVGYIILRNFTWCSDVLVQILKKMILNTVSCIVVLKLLRSTGSPVLNEMKFFKTSQKWCQCQDTLFQDVVLFSSLPEEAESPYVTLVINDPASTENLLGSSAYSGANGTPDGDSTTAGVECARSPKSYTWFAKVYQYHHLCLFTASVSTQVLSAFKSRADNFCL